MYEGDQPNAERRAAALALDRELLRELLGQEELRELIEPGALETVEADLQRLSDRTRADSVDALHDVLRRVGDLTLDEAVQRGGTRAWLEQLRGERRAIELRVGGEKRWVAAEDAGLYRDALGAVPPSGLPEAFIADVPDAMERLVRRYARTHGPFETPRAARALRPRPHARARTARAVGRPRARRAAPRRDAARVVRPRGPAAPAPGVAWPRCGPRSSPPTSARSPASRRAGRAWTATRPSGAGVDRLREVLVPLQGLALPLEVWERDVLPRRTGAYSPAWMDQLCASGEVVWVGAGALGRRSGRVALYFRDDAPLIGPPPKAGEPPEEPVHEAVRERLRAGPCFFTDLLTDVAGFTTEELQNALWDLVWAGEATNDAFAPLRSPKLTATPSWSQRARAERRRTFGTRRRGGAQPAVQGRWSLTGALFGKDHDPSARRRTQAELLLERYGIVTREQVLAEGIPGGFSSLYDSLAALETIGIARRGYFVEGLGGAQFALPGAVERLRAQHDDDAAPPIVLAATDPAQPYGARAEVAGDRRAARPARPARTSCWPAPSRCCSSSAAARACRCSSTHDDPRDRAVAGGARRGRQARPDQAARAREGRRRAGRRLGLRGAAARARLPRRAAQAHAHHLIAAKRARSFAPRAGFSDSTHAIRPSRCAGRGRRSVERCAVEDRLQRVVLGARDVRARVDDDTRDGLARTAAHHAGLGGVDAEALVGARSGDHACGVRRWRSVENTRSSA